MTSGIILVDKPQEFTSFDVIAKLRGILKTSALGHAGTLDPMATGVLPVFMGRATKAIPYLENNSKRYTASFRLGISTDTQDTSGRITREREVFVSRGEVESAALSFKGRQKQIPPMYSAVKVGGRRLYDLARQGIELEREAREIEFFNIDLIGGEDNEYVIDVLCSRGAYIRTLCNDIGEKLGCGAALASLARTEACGYRLSDCLSLDKIEKNVSNGDFSFVRPLESAFENWPKITLPPREAKLFLNGVKLRPDEIPGFCGGERFAVFGGEGLLGLARFDKASGLLKIERIFSERN
ncbi:MAG: tRNA pseudouridine(55) synthase TruB [Oscillospiraceae bacterium]|nr:tRNA pseudouridine(55) synthase TruB [Oscillospiraceae bacterium]